VVAKAHRRAFVAALMPAFAALGTMIGPVLAVRPLAAVLAFPGLARGSLSILLSLRCSNAFGEWTHVLVV
jgi:hypothetical protein